MCKDSDAIPKVNDAGSIRLDSEGRRIQIMHNGLKVVADGYYGSLYADIITGLRGHHEPQEELVFYSILKTIAPGASMVELGAYWSYYSLWFQHVIPDACNIMVEPVLENMKIGKANFALNSKSGTFLNALVGSLVDDTISPVTLTVDKIMADYDIDELSVLHSDIQGHEIDMLMGARTALKCKAIDFIVISTHGEAIHQKVLRHLHQHAYYLIAEHTPAESYSWDGLVAVTRRNNFPSIHISKRMTPSIKYFKSIIAKLYYRYKR